MNEPLAWISLIVLAAGRSKRFGSNKLLFKLNGDTLIERIVRRSSESKANEVIVVVGHEADKIMAILKNLSCKIIFNRIFEQGQSSSVVAGVKFAKDHARAVMILPGDMPLMRTEFINKVIDEYHSTQAAMVATSHQGKMGHPILIDAALFDKVLKIREETFGLKEVIKENYAELRLVEVESQGVLTDLDVHEDLIRLKE